MVRKSPANAGDARDTVSVLGSWRYPRVENRHPLQYSNLGSLLDKRAWWATVQAIRKSRTWLTKHNTHTHAHAHTHMHIHTHMCVHTHACTCTRMHTHAHSHTHTCAHTHILLKFPGKVRWIWTWLIDHLFCGMSSSLCLSDVFSWLNTGEIWKNCCCSFSSSQVMYGFSSSLYWWCWLWSFN